MSWHTVGMTIQRKTTFSSMARRFCRDTAGNIALSFALLTPVLVGASAVAYDTAYVKYLATKLQSTSDQAVLGATQELLVASVANKTINSAAEAYVKSAHPNMEIAISTQVDRKQGQVKLKLEYVWQPTFGKMLGSETLPIVVSSSAKLIGEGNICVLALSSDALSGVGMLEKSKITANGCGVFSNSKSAKSISLDTPAQITAEVTCASGGVDAPAGNITPAARTECAAIPDPLSSRTEPKPVGCDFTNFKVSKGSIKLSPGTYCGGIQLLGQVQAEFEKGHYNLVTSGLKMSGQARATGSNVSFYFSGDSSTLDLIGQSAVSFSGAESGDLAGILFFASRSQPIGTNHRIAASAVSKLTGTLYFPTGDLLIDPKGAQVAAQSEYTVIIADTVRLQEGPEMILNSNYGSTSVPVPEGIKVSGTVVLTE
jgi:Flp pilus assembly protein TadG